MGAMNKHPSCQRTWAVTTQTSLAVSEALASLMRGNAHLERVLIAEFEGERDVKSAMRMTAEVEASKGHLTEALGLLLASIKLSEEVGNPYKGDFDALSPDILAELWEQNFLEGCKDEVRKICGELKHDHIATARRFVGMINDLIQVTGPVINCFRTAAEYAETCSLKEAIENGRFPLQRTYAVLLSRYLAFMKEYLIDSLVATEVVFVANGKSLLAS